MRGLGWSGPHPNLPPKGEGEEEEVISRSRSWGRRGRSDQ